MEVCDRPGVWRRAGEIGHVCGLALGEAMRSLPHGASLDRDFARALFVVAEGAFVEAFDEQLRAEQDAMKDKQTGDQ